jgi:predicted O-methyltransferase YrrM
LITISKNELQLRPIDWCGLHREYLIAGEMQIIAALLRGIEAELMIEFGCRDGRTAYVLMQNVPSLKKYIGVDVPMSYQPGLSHQRNEMVAQPGWYMLDDPRFELIIRERGSLDLAAHDLPHCDAVFIDGDHSEAVVDHDSELARALVSHGGLVLWHDYNNYETIGVRRVVDKLAAQDWPIHIVKDTWLAYCRFE